MGTEFFVQLSHQEDFRRTLLEASKETIFSLKEYHKILAYRKKKFELVASLKEQIKELVMLLEKLQELLPEKEFPKEASFFTNLTQEIKRDGLSGKKDDSNTEDLSRLDTTLSKIEHKLEELE